MRVLSYGTGNGYPPLRELLGGRARRARADQVLVTNGSLQGFVFLLETLLAPGDLVAVESPTYDRALLQLRLHGMEVLPIAVEDDGMDVEALAAACAEGRVPRLLYTIPNFQNPSGATLSAHKRRRAGRGVRRARHPRARGRPLRQAALRGRPPAGPVRDSAGPGRVIFTSSFSKTVAPGLRVGYLVAPPDIAAKLAGAASQTYISPALLSEAAIHQLIEGGHLPGNIARVTELMRERRDAMVEGLRHFPEGSRCVAPAGGFFCWVTLPEGSRPTSSSARPPRRGSPT